MVLILDGNSEIDAHVRSNFCYLICWRLIRFKAATKRFFSRKRPILLHSCATFSESPSHIRTMPLVDQNKKLSWSFVAALIIMCRGHTGPGFIPGPRFAPRARVRIQGQDSNPGPGFKSRARIQIQGQRVRIQSQGSNPGPGYESRD